MAALPILRGLHELLWYLDAAVAWPSSSPASGETAPPGRRL